MFKNIQKIKTIFFGIFIGFVYTKSVMVDEWPCNFPSELLFMT